MYENKNTTRSFEEIVTDFDLYRKAKAIREYLAKLAGCIPRLNENPNFYFGGTVDGLILIHYYGLPSAVGTPFGQWACTGGGCAENDNWFQEAEERLELVELFPELQNSNGCYGPIHAITKDLDGNPLPQVDWRLTSIGIGFNAATAIEAFQVAGGQVDPYELNQKYWARVKKEIGYQDYNDESAVNNG
jgi:hypothetical protein